MRDERNEQSGGVVLCHPNDSKVYFLPNRSIFRPILGRLLKEWTALAHSIVPELSLSVVMSGAIADHQCIQVFTAPFGRGYGPTRGGPPPATCQLLSEVAPNSGTLEPFARDRHRV